MVEFGVEGLHEIPAKRDNGVHEQVGRDSEEKRSIFGDYGGRAEGLVILDEDHDDLENFELVDDQLEQCEGLEVPDSVTVYLEEDPPTVSIPRKNRATLIPTNTASRIIQAVA